MTDDLGFVCPNCSAPIKYTAGMTLGEILSLRHNSQHQAVKIDVLKMEVNVKDARIAELEAALKPFSDMANYLDEPDDGETCGYAINCSDLRAAAAALKETGDE